MPESYPNPQSSSTVKSAKSFKPSKFEQFKSWIGTEQEANQSKNIRVTETGITPIKEITQKALTKLRSTIDNKSFQKVIKGIATTGAVVMMNLGHVNPAEAKSNVKVESSPTKTEQVVTQVVNIDVSSPKAQKLKKDFGFEKVSDTDYSKMLKATYSSSESKYDVQKLKIESETKGIQNPDGTLNRQRAVNKLHLNYLRGIESITAPTIGENTTGSTKTGKGKETKADTINPVKTVTKEAAKKDTMTKPVEIKSVKPLNPTKSTSPEILPKETSKTIKTEAILESGKINLDSPAVQKLKAHLGLNDLADDQQFKKFNDFVKTNITKGEGTATLKNSAIEDYLKAHPTRPVTVKPEVKSTPITTPTPKDPTVKPEAVPSPVPSVTETKASPSPVESPKPEPSTNPKLNTSETINNSDVERYNSYWKEENFKNQGEKTKYIQHTISEINLLIKENSLNRSEAEYLQNANNLENYPLIYVYKRWLQNRSSISEADKKHIIHLRKSIISDLKKLNLK
jgi:hypothetical protein